MRAMKYTALCLFAILALAFLLHGTLPQVSTGSWLPANSLAEGRGQSAGGALNSLEIFAPATGTFTALVSGTLSSARQDHAAAVLADGRVLIAGGSDGANALNSADIYDPSIGSVSAAANMSGPRTK